jgi:hypothetical protein
MLAIKARCCSYILDPIKRAIETEENEARVTDLERGRNPETGRTDVRPHGRYLEYAAKLGWRRRLESNRRIETDPTDYESGCAASVISTGVHYQWVAAANQFRLSIRLRRRPTAWLRSWLWFCRTIPTLVGKSRCGSRRLGLVPTELVCIAAGGSGSALFTSHGLPS